ncbi:MAG: Smr/MutS family protein [Dehalococcoidia bacterium]|nr:Smr/MutS family protein [Dehalococcoidia bacterium]
MSRKSPPYPEVDLHRMTVDEAIPKLEQFLYEAYCAGVGAVRVNHGKGTGTLRASVRAWLARQESVKSFRAGMPWEGGDGVTIVELAE